MQVRVLETAIDRLLGSGRLRPTLKLFGGEPLLEMPLVRRAVEMVRGSSLNWIRPDVRIFTNGILLNEETTRFLVEADVHITLSIDGLPGAQDQRGPGSFHTLDRILARLGRDHPGHLRARLAVSATLTSRNVAYLADSFRYFVSRGVRDILVVPVITHDSGWDSDARDELDRQLADVVGESLRVYVSSGEVPFRQLRGDGQEISPQARAPCLCAAADQEVLFVDVDGSLAPCAAMARSCLRDPPPLLREAIETLGPLHLTDPGCDSRLVAREQKIRDLPLFTNKAAKYSAFGRCRDCPAIGNCFICPASIGFSDGPADPDRVPAIQCDFNRLVDRHRITFQRAVHQALVSPATQALHGSPLDLTN